MASPDIIRFASLNDLAGVKAELARGQDPNVRNDDGLTALKFAALAPNARMVAALLRAGARPDDRPDDRGTPLMSAAWCGDVASVAILLGAGADTTLVDSQGRTALDRARRGKRVGVVELLEEWRK